MDSKVEALEPSKCELIVYEKNKKVIYFAIKRMFDILCALCGCMALIPVAIVVKVVSVINKDFNPIFYTQNRIGLHGKEFKLYKLRTMVPNADAILMEMLEKDEAMAKEYKENKKLRNDPRITKIGDFLRKTSLDELPQMINVLKGEMALIGNRPYLPREKEDMGYYYWDIIRSKPGITGFWQVSGRSDVTFLRRLKLEKYYSNNMSLAMDIKIFIDTFVVVLLKKGAK